MSTRGTTRQAREVATNPIVAGSVILLVVIIGVIISYNANHGLPFVPTYDVVAEVPDAAELIEGGSEVRIGGARVGQVKTIQAVPGRGDVPAFARLGLALDQTVPPLPTDTRFMVRPRSILGAKYLQVTPGDSEQKVAPGGVLPLKQATPLVELDEAFNVFDADTSRGLQSTIVGLGDGLAGRGSAINTTMASFARSIPPLQRFLRVLGDPRTGLDDFVRGLATVSSALEPVAPTLGDLFDNGATTLAALDGAGDDLERTLVELPPTEVVGTRTLTRAAPLLADAAAITRDIRPATRIIGDSSRRLAASLRDATPPLRRLPQIADPLIAALNALDGLASKPETKPTVRGLTATTISLRSTLRTLVPAQLTCNIGPIFFRNVGSVLSQGDAAGHWLSFLPVSDVDQMLQSPKPAANLHANPYPQENATECEAGNEPFDPGQRIGNPGGAQPTATDQTAPPPGVRELARGAGLLRGAGR